MTSLQLTNGCGEPRRANSSVHIPQSPVDYEASPPRRHHPASITVRHRLQHDLVIGRIYNARVAETLAERDSSGRFRPPTGPRQEAVAVLLGRPAPSLPANQTRHSRQPRPRIGQVTHGEARARGELAHPRTRPRGVQRRVASTTVLLPNKQQVALCPLVLTYPADILPMPGTRSPR